MFVDNMYLACAITVIVEVLFFAAAGYWRNKYFLPLCAVVNVATNLSLSLIIRLSAYFIYWTDPRTLYVLIALEAAIVFVEYRIYSMAEGRSRKLLLLTALANLASIAAGYAYWLLFY